MFLDRSITPQHNGYEQNPEGSRRRDLSGKASERRQHLSQVTKTQRALAESRRKTCLRRLYIGGQL